MGHLHKIMPNIRGPSEHKRRLYASVIFSILLYGAPVWWMSLRDRTIRGRIDNVSRRVAQRVCRAYRTVSCTAALVVAGIPPLHIIIGRLARAFHKIRIAEREQDLLDWGVREKINLQLKAKSIQTWKGLLVKMQRNDPGLRIRQVIVPVLEEWCGRKRGGDISHVSNNNRTWLLQRILV